MSIREGITEILRQPIKIDINIKGFRPELKRDCKQADQIITLIKANYHRALREYIGKYLIELLEEKRLAVVSGGGSYFVCPRCRYSANRNYGGYKWLIP